MSISIQPTRLFERKKICVLGVQYGVFRDMKYRRAYAAAAVYNGRFIVCGGENQPGNYLTSVECFDPESGVWHELEDMPTPLYGPSIISDGQKLILMGGTDGNTPLNFVFELSNPEITGKWKQLPPMKGSRSGFSAEILGNEIFVIGGWNGKCINQSEIFSGNSWRDGPPLPYSCCLMSSVLIPQSFADLLCNYAQ